MLLKNSALGAKPEDQTEQKCTIAYVGIFMAPSHWRAAAPGHAGQRTSDSPLDAAVEIDWTDGPKWVESVSSLMQETAVPLLDAATVGNRPHC